MKIRGFRIELGEIEAKLAQHEGVKDAVVMAREDAPGDKRLVAYYTAQEENAGAEAEDLRAHLQAQLPAYMVPAAYVRLDSLPLTPNGKLDRRALPEPEADAYATRGYAAPQGELEETLGRLWCEVLGVERVGRHDHFFELGGHSLLAVRLISQVRQRLDVELAVGELFAHQSVASMASMLQGRTPDTQRRDTIVPVRTGGTQRPLFLMHEFTGLDLYFPALAAHIDPDIPVYGLSGIPWGETQLQTFGGVLAYEIAMQLVGQDEEVEFVGLIDTSLPKLVENDKSRWLPQSAHKRILLEKCDIFWKRQAPAETDIEPIVRTLSGLRADVGSVDFDGLVRRCREKGVLHPELAAYSAGELWQYVDREVAHGHALANYTVFPISVPVHVFVAEERREDAPPLTGSLGWDEVLPWARLHCVTVPGDHLTMMEAPHVQALGRAISEAVCTITARQIPVLSEMSYQPLVTIQNGGAGHAPVFCVPGAGGSVTGFVGLADTLGPAWPMHGLQPRGLDGALVPYSSVEAAAEANLKAIDAVQSDGPIHLIGHSFGGWVVFEMASRLLARGRIVASLTLIDSEAPGGDGMVGKPYTATGVLERLVEAMQLAAGESFGIDAAVLRAQDDAGQMRQLHSGMVRVGMLPQRSTPDAMRGPARVFGTALRTIYLPRHPYTGPVRLVVVDDPALDVASNQLAQRETIEGWRRHAPNLCVWHVPGNHFTVLKAPHVQELAVWWRTAFEGRSEQEVANESM
ncbi:alpha/beta fold hydrolase [Pararobbsia alpina]|uniref:D-alanine--D-alanyl carrier protein ligase n=1 Tax=Pararobbsia alpina TaxID=621374 RepID=A0A6S7BDT7_9BURK|nr:alpha/beta fold hydrolase [Pararobbsia alpina]CAB3787759.1 D-alanine--D-alanyl carrier protein ligase [Pararobbsia alpina]